jgi:CBS domain-containing protein
VWPELRAFVQTQILTNSHAQIRARSDGHFSGSPLNGAVPLQTRRTIMRVAETMTRDVRVAKCDQSIAEVAKMMADCDCGVVPVEENDRLIGMITDRDLVIRALAQGKAGETKVRDVMSAEVKYCFEGDDLDSVAHNMGDLQVRRLPVVNRDKRLVGIVSLGDIASAEKGQPPVAEALSSISEPASQHAATGQRPH